MNYLYYSNGPYVSDFNLTLVETIFNVLVYPLIHISSIQFFVINFYEFILQ